MIRQRQCINKVLVVVILHVSSHSVVDKLDNCEVNREYVVHHSTRSSSLHMSCLSIVIGSQRMFQKAQQSFGHPGLRFEIRTTQIRQPNKCTDRVWPQISRAFRTVYTRVVICMQTAFHELKVVSERNLAGWAVPCELSALL